MKRYIHSEYIPDITERYPEGMRDVDYYDDVLSEVTVGDALDQFKRMVNEDEIYQVEVYDQVGNCWCIANSIDRAIQKLKDSELLDKFISDAQHNDGLVDITFKNSRWR